MKIAKEHGYTAKSKAPVEAKTGTGTFLVFANSGIVLEQYYEQPFFRDERYQVAAIGYREEAEHPLRRVDAHNQRPFRST